MANDDYWARWEEYQRTGKWPANKTNRKRKPKKAHPVVSPQIAAAAESVEEPKIEHPTLFDLPEEPPKPPPYHGGV